MLTKGTDHLFWPEIYRKLGSDEYCITHQFINCISLHNPKARTEKSHILYHIEKGIKYNHES